MIPEQIKYLESIIEKTKTLGREHSMYVNIKNVLEEEIMESITLGYGQYFNKKIDLRGSSRATEFFQQAMCDVVDSAIKIIEAEISETEIIQPKDISAKLEEIQKEFDAKLQTKTKRGIFK